MDITPLINGLYGIPVLGLLFQAVGYLVAVLPPNSSSIILSSRGTRTTRPKTISAARTIKIQLAETRATPAVKPNIPV